MKNRAVAALALLSVSLLAPVALAATASGPASPPSCEGEGPKKPDSPPKS